jgi:hypothetical protein
MRRARTAIAGISIRAFLFFEFWRNMDYNVGALFRWLGKEDVPHI